jgi:hypothetical protein
MTIETATKPLVAYHNDPELKAATLAEMAAHREADELARGTYWEAAEGYGCAVGCLTHDPEGGHEQYPIRWGIPLELAWLEDILFENLPVEDAMAWPERFLAAIEPGVDLSGVYGAWSVWLMLDPDHGNVTRCGGFPDAETAVRQVGELWRRRDATAVEWVEWAAAATAAESAVRAARSAALATRSMRPMGWAVESAAAEAAAWAAESAAVSARSATRSVWSARATAATSAQSAPLAHWRWMAEVLLTCLQEAPLLEPAGVAMRRHLMTPPTSMAMLVGGNK